MENKLNHIIIIDNILPEDLRQQLLVPNRPYKAIQEVYYPGETGFLSTDEQTAINQVLKLKLPIEFKDLQCRLRKTNQANQTKSESFIHTDSFAEFSSIIYLNDGQGKNGEPTGTYFWESKITHSRGLRIENMAKMYKDLLLVNKMSFELENWTCWNKIEQKANRCILFPSQLFHSPPLTNIDIGESVTLDIFLNIKFDFIYKKRTET